MARKLIKNGTEVKVLDCTDCPFYDEGFCPLLKRKVKPDDIGENAVFDIPDDCPLDKLA